MKAAAHAEVSHRQRQQANVTRKTMTEAERRRALRRRLPIEGSHFRRQVAIDRYIVDFCCVAAKLVIEVDGNLHGTDLALVHGAERTRVLEAHGFQVLRFSNFDVARSLDSVLDTIFAALERTPIPCPSPQGGGGMARP